MEYTIYYETVQRHETTVEADNPEEALQSILEQWDNNEYWPFDAYEEPVVTNAWMDEVSEDADPKTIMSVNSVEEHPVHIIRKLAGMEQK